MGKPILERLRRPSYWYADQLPHILVGAAICAAITWPLAHWTALSPLLSAMAGVTVSEIVGVAYELRQNWNDEHSRGDVEDSTIDRGFWSLGAICGMLAAL